MAYGDDFSKKLYDLTGGILGSPTKKRELTDREKLIKQKQRETRAASDLIIESAKSQQPEGGRFQLTATEALIPGATMVEGDKYRSRTPSQIDAAEEREETIIENVKQGVVKLPGTEIGLMPMGAKVLSDLWVGGSTNRQLIAPAAAAFVPEVPTEEIGKASLQDVAATVIETNTDETLKKGRGMNEEAPAPAEVTYGKGDGVTTDKAGKTTPTSAEDDAAQNASASSQAAKDLQNDAVKADDDAKVGQGVLGDATKTWWFNVTDSLGDALINYGINFAASGGDRGKAFAAAGQTLAGGFDKYDRRQQIGELKSMGYTDAEIINYINTSQLSTPIFTKAGRKGGSTESQQKAEGGASRADFVNKTWGNKYGKLASAGDYPLSTRTGQVRGMFDEQGMVRKIFDFANPEYAKAFKDEMGYLAGVLRPESGSAIGQMEWENYGHIYFPRYGDTQEDIARKGLLRQMTIKTLQSMGDPTDQEASLAVDQLTSYADKVVDYDPDSGAYILDDGNYLIID